MKITHEDLTRIREHHATDCPICQGGDMVIREILESLCQRDGLSLESDCEPGMPARNFELTERLGIPHVFQRAFYRKEA